MKNIKVSNLGQMKEADINFNDLTLFVGPQATGKSILLRLIELLFDSKNVLSIFIVNGFDLGKNNANFQQLYFGEEMSNLWHTDPLKNKNQKIALNHYCELKKVLCQKCPIFRDFYYFMQTLNTN